MNILKLAKEHENLIIEYRRHIHKNPELSGKEFNTLAFISKKLTEFGVSYVEVENGGILAFIGSKDYNKSVLLRADIDALPMQEASVNDNGVAKLCPISEVNGVSHMCGHDAHAAMLLVTAKILQDNINEINGRIILCFERGEEGGNNIEYILRYIEKENIKIDACHALHVVPDIESGKIAIMYGPVIAGCMSFDITLEGLGGHGSRPDLSNNPLDCFNAIYNDLNSIKMRDVVPYEPFTLTICKVNYGTTWNIIAPTLNFAGNGRFFNQEEAGLKVRTKFLEILEANTKLYGCTYKINYMRGPSFGIINNKDCVDIARAGIAKNLGNNAIHEYTPQFASESFSLMQRLYPGAYAMLGIGNSELGTTAVPHSPYFDIDETVLHLGVVENISFAMEFLNSDYTPEFKKFDGTVDKLFSSIITIKNL